MRVELHRDKVPPGRHGASFMACLGKKGRSQDPDTFEEVLDLLKKLSSRREMWTWAYVFDEVSVYALLYRTSKGDVVLRALREGATPPSGLKISQEHVVGEVKTVKFPAARASAQQSRVRESFETLKMGDVLVNIGRHSQPSVLKAWIHVGPKTYRVLSRGSESRSYYYTHERPFFAEG